MERIEIRRLSELGDDGLRQAASSRTGRKNSGFSAGRPDSTPDII